MYIYIYIYTDSQYVWWCFPVCMYVYIYIHKQICIYIYMYIYIYVYTDSWYLRRPFPACMYIYTYKYIYTHIFMYIHICICIYIYIYVLYIYICIYIYIYVYMDIRYLRWLRSICNMTHSRIKRRLYRHLPNPIQNLKWPLISKFSKKFKIEPPQQPNKNTHELPIGRCRVKHFQIHQKFQDRNPKIL